MLCIVVWLVTICLTWVCAVFLGRRGCHLQGYLAVLRVRMHSQSSASHAAQQLLRGQSRAHTGTPTPSPSPKAWAQRAAAWSPSIPVLGRGVSPVPSWARWQSLDGFLLVLPRLRSPGASCIPLRSSHILPCRRFLEMPSLAAVINNTSALYSHNHAALPIPPPDPVFQIVSFGFDLFLGPAIQLALDQIHFCWKLVLNCWGVLGNYKKFYLIKLNGEKYLLCWVNSNLLYLEMPNYLNYFLEIKLHG